MIPTASKEETQALIFYAGVMDEIKLRFQAIETLLGGKTGLIGGIAIESYHLQIRMICELIALGCLLAHGDIEATKSKTFTREYHAKKIMDLMEELHPNFFPRHARIQRTGYGWHADFPEDADFISKPELLSLYNRTGTHLHRGSLKAVLSDRRAPQQTETELIWTAQRIANLLAVHSISRVSGSPWVCFLSDKRTGKANVYAMAPAEQPDGATPPAPPSV